MSTQEEAEAAAAWPAEAWRAAIAAALPAYGYRPAADAAEGAGAATVARLAAYLQAVVRGQARARLVGAVAPEALVRRHLGESLYLGAVLPLGRQRVVDLGAGAGFPGLALALAWPGLITTLVESTGKKAAFLRSTVRQLGVEAQVTVWEGFVPRQAAPGRAPLAGAELVTARAVEQMERLPQWLGRWLDPGAQVALWTTRSQAEAWRQAGRGWEWGGFHPLPAAQERGILLARWRGSVPRETKPA
jgi:16S rRNA (guanine527-N7)-methyltransferase